MQTYKPLTPDRPIAEVEAELAQIEAARAADVRKAAAEHECRAKVEAERERAEYEREAAIGVLRETIARDVGVPVPMAPDELMARCGAASHSAGELHRVFYPLIALFKESPDLTIASEARHALAAARLLPAVPARSPWPDAKAVRTLPAPELDVQSTAPRDKAEFGNASSPIAVLAAALGVAVPRERKPTSETPAQASRRLPQVAVNVPMFGETDPTSSGIRWPQDSIKLIRAKAKERRDEVAEVVNHAQERRRELDLIAERHRLEREQCRLDHLAALHEMRVGIVAELDRALGDLEIGPAWYWTRALRRWVAWERTAKLTGAREVLDVAPAHLYSLAVRAGARFDFNDLNRGK